MIADEADRLARIVNDVLWASRLDSGHARMSQIESCDAGEAASQRRRRPRGPTSRPSVELESTSGADAPRVAADPDKLRQVLDNLIDNAVKYSPDGGRIGVGVDAPAPRVRFSVADEGIGIPPDEHERIFEKFYRLDPELTRGVGGTGLGLYICRELVRRMDGRSGSTRTQARARPSSSSCRSRRRGAGCRDGCASRPGGVLVDQ